MLKTKFKKQNFEPKKCLKPNFKNQKNLKTKLAQKIVFFSIYIVNLALIGIFAKIWFKKKKKL